MHIVRGFEDPAVAGQQDRAPRRDVTRSQGLLGLQQTIGNRGVAELAGARRTQRLGETDAAVSAPVGPAPNGPVARKLHGWLRDAPNGTFTLTMEVLNDSPNIGHAWISLYQNQGGGDRLTAGFWPSSGPEGIPAITHMLGAGEVRCPDGHNDATHRLPTTIDGAGLARVIRAVDGYESGLIMYSMFGMNCATFAKDVWRAGTGVLVDPSDFVPMVKLWSPWQLSWMIELLQADQEGNGAIALEAGRGEAEDGGTSDDVVADDIVSDDFVDDAGGFGDYGGGDETEYRPEDVGDFMDDLESAGGETEESGGWGLVEQALDW
jgi:hypothetical protein